MASRFRFLGILLGMAFAAGASAQAQPPATQSLSSSLGVVVFPAKGQSAQQQGQDEGECYAWSKGQTGIDPMAPPPAAAPPPQQAAAQQQKDTFNKGFAACLEAKGYTVK